ncbi:SgcJ/EcaC family oxidoreductase [Sphaerisporangium rhizosphaerae]|uniref:SgcJ/EcaC family oxidoreductase n=1 Tax=Sphaerisporangium rhizosphaerae TaxID=2269375 RepID=A0ABW2P980_9ACTN
MENRRRGNRASGLAAIGGAGLALLCALPPAAAAAAPRGADPDAAALGDIWRRQAEAWGKGDAAAYAAMYTPDADLVNIKGEHLHGRSVIAARIGYYFNNQLRNTQITRLAESVRMVAPLTAIILRKDCVLYAAESVCRPSNLSINSSVAVKRQGHWLIESFQNTLVSPQEERQRPFRMTGGPAPDHPSVALAAAQPPPVAPNAPALAPPAAAAGDIAAELTALRRLWLRQADAWSKGDGKAYAATYTPDADFVNVTGEHLRTSAEIGEKFQRYLHAQLAHSRIVTLEEKIDLVSPTVAFIIRKGCVHFGAENKCRPNTVSYNTSVVVKKSGQWLVRSFHNTLVNQPGRKTTPSPSPTRT